MGGFDAKKFGGKVTQNLGDFHELRQEIAKLVFGDTPDLLLSGINKFM